MQYYKYLEMANEGDIRPFIRFVAECTEKTLDLYLWATSDMYKVPLLAEKETNDPYAQIILDNDNDDRISGSGEADGDAIRL